MKHFCKFFQHKSRTRFHGQQGVSRLGKSVMGLTFLKMLLLLKDRHILLHHEKTHVGSLGRLFLGLEEEISTCSTPLAMLHNLRRH